METGAFAMFDALGTKGIWKNRSVDEVLRKFETIENRFNAFVDRQLGGKGHPNTKNVANGIAGVQIGFVSDTVVVAFVMKDERHPHFAVMMAARWASQVVRLGVELSPPWTYRGAISYGQFAINKTGHYFIGPAVDEAARWHERANAALIWLTESAKTALVGAGESDFDQGPLTIEQHDIPLKAYRNEPSSVFRTYVASPFDWPDPLAKAERVAKKLLATFDLTQPEVAEKHTNTEAFLQKHLVEYRGLLAKYGMDR